MARKSTAQVNIRSEFVKQRVGELARQTGKTATQVVEDAVRAYRPESSEERPPAPEGMMWKGRFLVLEPRGGPTITLEETNRAIWEGRERDLWGYDED